MSTAILILLLLGIGILMIFISYGSLYGIATLLDIETIIEPRVLFAFFVISCIALYGISFGAFAGVQKDTCGEVRNWKQIGINAAIPVGFHIVLFTLVTFVAFFRNLIGNLFPPDTSEVTKNATAFAFYSFWAAMMGGALGGTLSGSCKQDSDSPDIKDVFEKQLMPEEEVPIPNSI